MQSKWKLFFYIAGILLLIFGFTFFISGPLTLHLTYSYLVSSIQGVTGLNKYIANIVALLGVIALFYGIKLYFKSALIPWKKAPKEKFIGATIIIALLIVHNLFMYQFTKSTFFTFSEGEVSKWYADTPEGVVFYDSPGFDPKYGIELKPVTPEMITALERKKLGQIPDRIDPADIDSIDFFDKATGEKKVWYAKSPDGQYELFSNPGYHPTSGAKLEPVTTEIYASIMKLSKQISAMKHQNDIYANIQYANSPAREDVAVFIIDTNKSESTFLAGKVADKVQSLGYAPITTLFSPGFATGGEFDNIFSGNQESLKRIELDKHCDHIILGLANTEFKEATNFKNIVTATSNMRARVITCSTGAIAKEYGVDAAGTGFTREEAEKMAFERIAQKLTINPFPNAN